MKDFRPWLTKRLPYKISLWVDLEGNLKKFEIFSFARITFPGVYLDK